MLLLAEVLAVYEDEVVQLQQVVLQQGADRGVPGILYQLADLQVSTGMHYWDSNGYDLSGCFTRQSSLRMRSSCC